MTTERYNFWYKKEGLAPVWCSSRTNTSGTMHEWIKDLETKYIVRRSDKNFLLIRRVQ